MKAKLRALSKEYDAKIKYHQSEVNKLYKIQDALWAFDTIDLTEVKKILDL